MELTEATVLEVTWRRALIIWWSLLWRSAVFAGLLGALLGGIGGVVVAVEGRPDLGATVGRFLGQLGAIPVSLFVLRWVLRKRFKGFSIRLVANSESTTRSDAA